MNQDRSVALVPSNTFSIGQRLRRERLRLGWSQERLAEALQTSAVSVSRWERDVVLPQPHYQQQLAQMFHSTVETLFLSSEPVEENAIPPESTRYWYVPHLRNPYFTGRQEVLEQLHLRLHTSLSTVISQPQAVSGLGGIGKTQIALEYAYRHADDYAAILWIAAEAAETILESFARIAEVLSLSEQRETEQQRIVDAVQRWLVTHPRWLLIWDNVEDVDLFHRFVPKASFGATLLTTRRQALGSLAVGVELSPLSPQESLLFLLCRAKLLPPGASQDQVGRFIEDTPAQQAAAAQELVVVMYGLPLALDQVGAYVEETKCSLLDYLLLYQHRRAEMLHRRGSVIPGYPQSVATVWLLSLKQVERQNLAATDLLQVCAMLHPEAIPEEIFTQGALHLGEQLLSVAGDPFQLNEVLSTLALYSLLHRNGEDHTLSMHQLVQAVLQARMNEQERAQWQQRAVRMLHALFPEVCVEVWRRCERLLLHVLTVASAIPDQTEDWELAEVLRKAADYLTQRASYKQAEPLYQRALRVKERVLGSEHPEVALLLLQLTALYGEQGKYEHIEMLCQRALSIFEQVLGPGHIHVAKTLNLLATLYQVQGKYEQAGPLYQRVLDICEQAMGPEHFSMGYPLIGLADLCIKRRKYEQAEPLYQRALHLWEQTLGWEHPRVAYPLNELANLYAEQGKHKQAELLYQRALCLQERHLGQDHPETARSLAGLAKLYERQGKEEQAESLLQHAWAIFEQHFGQDYPETVKTRKDYCRLLDQRRGATKSLLTEPQAHAKPLQANTYQRNSAEMQATQKTDPLAEFPAACCELHSHAWSRASDLWQALEY